MEHDHGVKVRVKRSKVTALVKGIEVLDKGGDLHLVVDALDHRAVGVLRGAFGERVFGFASEHGFGADEDQVEGCAREEVDELVPDVAGEGGLRARAEDEEADGGRGGADVGDVLTGAGSEGVEGVAEG